MTDNQEIFTRLQADAPHAAAELPLRSSIAVPAGKERDILRFSGWAIQHYAPFRYRHNAYKWACEPNTFADFASSFSSQHTRVLVGHRRDREVPLLGPMIWSPRVYGLRVGFGVDVGTHFGRVVAEAVRRGWLPHLSVGMRWFGKLSRLEWDSAAGKCHRIIEKATCSEVSLTHRPIASGTTVSVAIVAEDDWGDMPAKSLPTCKYERSALLYLLSSVGIKNADRAEQFDMTPLRTIAARQHAMLMMQCR